MALQVGRQIRCRGVGVVAADRVQDVDAVMGELVGRHGERVLAAVDQPALDQSSTLVSLTLLLPIGPRRSAAGGLGP